MQGTVRLAVSDFLKVVNAMQEDVILLGAAVRYVPTDGREFQSLQRAIDLQEEWFLVLKNPGARSD